MLKKMSRELIIVILLVIFFFILGMFVADFRQYKEIQRKGVYEPIDTNIYNSDTIMGRDFMIVYKKKEIL